MCTMLIMVAFRSIGKLKIAIYIFEVEIRHTSVKQTLEAVPFLDAPFDTNWSFGPYLVPIDLCIVAKLARARMV